MDVAFFGLPDEIVKFFDEFVLLSFPYLFYFPYMMHLFSSGKKAKKQLIA
jgi:hypothetical protein